MKKRRTVGNLLLVDFDVVGGDGPVGDLDASLAQVFGDAGDAPAQRLQRLGLVVLPGCEGSAGLTVAHLHHIVH